MLIPRPHGCQTSGGIRSIGGARCRCLARALCDAVGGVLVFRSRDEATLSVLADRCAQASPGRSVLEEHPASRLAHAECYASMDGDGGGFERCCLGRHSPQPVGGSESETDP